MRAWRVLAAAGLLAIAGCAPSATPGAAAGTQAEAPADASPPPAASRDAAAKPAGAVAPSSGLIPASPAVAPQPAPTTHTPPAATPTPGASPTPAAPSLACRSDADCAVKDVGSCCGYRPACVNAKTETFPEQVKARCADEGRMGICGFAPVSGCQCVEGQCAARPDTIGPAPPEPLQ